MIYDVVAPRDTRHVKRCGLFSRGTARKSDCDRFQISRELYYKRNVHADRPASFYNLPQNQNYAGRGCGGRIFNYGGRFTSPLYPNTYRNNTVCTWDVSVPRGFKIILQFLVFDIGTKKNCGNNNLKIYDIGPSGELLHGTYCGGVSYFV